MRDLGRIIAHIPARAGSKRVKSKNLRYLAGKPLLAYTLQAALKSKKLSSIYVNTASDIIAGLAKEMGVEVYMRPSELASDTTTSDQFNMDIIVSLNLDTLVMINPVCPFINYDDIDYAISEYENGDVDTLITVSSTQMQSFYKDQPINFEMDCQLEPTQNNKPVYICNWAIAIWDAQKFKKHFYNRGHAVFGNKRRLLPINPIKAIKISTEKDFQFAELIMGCINKSYHKKTKIRYWPK